MRRVCPSLPHHPAPADPLGVSTIKSLKNYAMNAWLRSLALLHVIAEHALRNAVSPELEIWYRDLSVTSRSTGPLCKARRGPGLCSVLHRASQRSQAACPWKVAEEARKSPGAKGNSGHPPYGIPREGMLA